MFNIFSNEKGQTMVEFALVIPIFLALVFGIIDMGWIAYEYVTFDYAYRQAAWEMSISYDDDNSHTITNTTAAPAIKNAIMVVSPTVHSSNLSVSNAQYQLWTEFKDYYTPRPDGHTDTHTRKWRYAFVTADVAYQIHPITYIGKKMFGPTLTLNKDLEKLRLIMTREGG